MSEPHRATLERQGLPAFDALDIRELPARGSRPIPIGTAASAACAALATMRATDVPASAVLDVAERTLEAFSRAGDIPSRVAYEAGLAAHDEYFRIRRVTGLSITTTYIRTLVHADALFLREVIDGGSTLPAEMLRDVERALETMRAFALGVEPAAVPLRTDWGRGLEPSAMRRWVRGHQIFTMLTQGLVIVADDLADALASAETTADLGSLEMCVDRLVISMRGAAGALRLTGDFPASDYCDDIRPTMTPPNVPEGFSGLLSSDHRALIARIRRMRPVWDRLAAGAPALHERVTNVVAYVYDEHKHVCAHFIGTDRPSLVSSAATSPKSGVAQLEDFKAARLQLVL